MHQRTLHLVIAAALLLSVATAPVAASGTESVVGEWNRHAAAAIMNPPTAGIPGAGQPPQAGELLLAMTQGAVYDAVNAIAGGYTPYLSGLAAAPATASQAAAAATAAHDVLMNVAPALPGATRDWVHAEYLATMAEIGAAEDADDVTDGVAAGANAASLMLAARAGDGRFASVSFRQGTGIGEWRPTASAPPLSDSFAWVANVRPFLLNSPSQMRSSGPLDTASAEYAAEYAEVKALGRQTGSSRSAEQTALATFYTVNPVELFNRTFRSLAFAQGRSLADEARLLAMLNLAGADALISCWNDKEYWSFWRPVTAIRNGDTDGNAATAGDAGWTPLIGTPPYPDHPSGYNCLSGAMMNTAVTFYGTKKVAFTIQQSTAAGAPTRSYERLTDVVKDTIDARIYLGIHFRTPDVQGAVMGKRVALWLTQRYFGSTD
jgi:hypothetical protein